MSYTRGRFGIEYDATRQRNGDDRHLLGWSLAAIAVLALVSFVSARGCARRVKLPDFTPPAPVAPVAPAPAQPVKDVPAAPSRAQSAKPVPAARPKAAPPKPVVSEATRLVERWLANSEDRPPLERTLLEKLLAAERAGNAALALDTIERLRQRPAMADLDVQDIVSNAPMKIHGDVITDDLDIGRLIGKDFIGKCSLKKVPVTELPAWFERALAAQEALKL